MSDDRHLLADLLNDDCVADGRRYEMLWSGARTLSAARTLSGAGSWGDAGWNFSAAGVINSDVSPRRPPAGAGTHLRWPLPGHKQSSSPIFFNPEHPA
jgi:hypothetical protein